MSIKSYRLKLQFRIKVIYCQEICVVNGVLQLSLILVSVKMSFILHTPSVLKKQTFRTVTRSPKHNFDLLSL
jgi:hypothetical protein